MVVFGELALTLVDDDVDGGLVVVVRRVLLLDAARHGCVTRHDDVCDALCDVEAFRERSHVKEHDLIIIVLDLATEDSCLDRSAIRHCLLLAQLMIKLLATKVLLDQLLDLGNKC